MNEEDDFNDLDTLMAIDPLDLSKQDLDRIIAYQRKQRTMREQGLRPEKSRGEAPAAVQLSELLAGLPKATPKPSTMKRRF